MTKEERLKLRKQQKAKKPNFIREDWQKRACIPLPWRRPRGLHSKMRHRFAGHRALVHPCYGSPVEVRGLDPSGYEPIVVHNLKEISKLDSKNQAAIIGSTVGYAKMVTILTKAKELGITILNLEQGIKDIDAELKCIQDHMTARKEKKAERKKTKESKSKAKEKAAEKKKPELEKKVSEEEQKKIAKEEKDKVLTQRKE